MGRIVVLSVNRHFVFSYPHMGNPEDVTAGRERHFKPGIHELDLSVPDDEAVLKHKWIQEGADGRIDIKGSKRATAAANLPPPPPITPNDSGETLGLGGENVDDGPGDTDDEDDKALAAAAAAAAAAKAAGQGEKSKTEKEGSKDGKTGPDGGKK